MSDLSRLSKKKKSSKSRVRPPFFLFIMIALFFAMVVFGFKWADNMFSPITKADTGLIDTETKDLIEKENNGPVNVLIIGTDERENEPSRSDTLILASLFPDEKQIKLLSIPRDTRVNIPGRKGFEKVSHAHAYGQADLAVKTVEGFLDTNIDFYIKTNFEGFKNIIDHLGGITLNVEKRMLYPEEDIDLNPGLQTLNGYDALAYVRFRSDGLGDIGRVERQQKFVSALTDHVARFATIPKIPNLVKEVNTHVKTNMSPKDILYFATKFITIDHNSIETIMLPGQAETINGGSYWVPDMVELDIVLEKMQSISNSNN